ncbi:MAG: chromosome segregation protein SMC [Planctomycetaceae bacterium]|nr:chromosome segregation protein SMC [Planctomycetaceae bacterium]
MLRAIELAGFKSFADRTRLEFEDGVSAIVGPNGSGKSNIVDAIKWVLGEQSMKKLRSNEATDVIFNGSADRPPMSSAEVTLTFDNSKKIFSLDTPEVHITRRVYRSGEGEYLINRQATRLKDIKELLSGTGLGTQAYSIIEQGRVESLLQSTAVQRRVIFEEAAGISRFNAKKLEVQRRLERVEQNLVRLADIVSEVDHQLRSARNQAGKAQLYRQYTQRLQELRIQSGWVDYCQRNATCKELQTEADNLNQIANSLATELEEQEKNLNNFVTEIEQVDLVIRRFEGEMAATRERISGEESTIELQSAQAEELETEIIHHGRQLIELNVRSVDIEEMMHKTNDDIRKAKRSTVDITESYQKLIRQGEELTLFCKEKQEEKDTIRKEIETKNKQNAKLAGSISGLESRLATLEHSKEQNTIRLEKLNEQNLELEQHCNTLHNSVDNLEDSVRQKQIQLEEARQRKNNRVQQLTQLTQELSDQKQKQSGMRERISVLEELIRKNEGLNPGVKEVLQQSHDPQSPFRHVFGLVADLLRVDVEAASLIELALGTNAQYVVVSPKAELFRHVERNAVHFAGRVGFIWLDPSQKETPWGKDKGFIGRAGVLGRADQFVNVDPKFVHLAQRLLGRTWIVENITVARQLYKESDDRTNFLTVSGELLTPDGALIVGPPNTSSGLITRRSELRTLNEQMNLLDAEVAEKEIAVAVAKERVAGDETDVEEETREHQKTVTEYDTQRLKLSAAEERFRQGLEQLQHFRTEIEKLDTQIHRAAEELEQTKLLREELNEQLAALEIRQIESKQQLEESELHYAEHQRKTTNTKIELAKSEERLDFLKERVRQFEDHLQERQNMLAEHQRRCQSLKERREGILLAILRIESCLATLYLKKEAMTRDAAGSYQTRQELSVKRTKSRTELKRLQHELQKTRTKAHAKQLELERCLQEQKTLIDRMQEDYGIDITKMSYGTSVENKNETICSEIPAEEQSADEFPVTEQSADELPVDEQSIDTFPVTEQSADELPVGEQSTDKLPADQQLPSPGDYQKEIEDLRTKLQRLGNVNLEAIETLENLETRYTTLSNQYNDLTGAKKSIEKIIEKINTESQQLFEETFNGVKQHFHELFQHLFGGGHADLVLEDPENILESGVDIIAKPPGKELKSVMLLSGGEKTLTCVALLLAFFRYKPNPVCILDECDAALDEGNIDRFVNVIKKFRTATQFLMITHSKKSMAAATTIYGVTMQESGISKPVSVRFVDVDENGNLLKAA